jgi:hypothetical protein
LKDRCAIVDRPPLDRLDKQQAKKNAWRHSILYPVLARPLKSPERRAAIDDILSRPLTDWEGRPTTISERTLHRWLATYEQQGIAAFATRARADKGKAKVIISLTAENAIPFATEAWERIAAELRRIINGHWKQGASLKLIQGRANILFRQLIEAEGFDHCHTLPDETFIVPRRFIEAERRPMNVYATFTKDRKTYEDNRFRTQRSRASMMPMDWVIGDVHPVDIVCMREDGSTAHARMIAWLDGATNRLRFDLVLCEPGTGIRNADLVHSFCAMVTDPTWGMPKTLYIDNGQEYLFAENINDAMQLVAQLRGGDGRTTRVVHARPYNASAKPIESMFSALEKMLQDIPGHTGGDRMNKKTERVGRPTKAFPGTFDQLETIVRSRVLEMEVSPMRGALAGRSPRQVYEAAINAGWQPVAVDPNQIMTVFATDRVCKITKGVITFAGQRWVCDEMASYFEDKIVARVPRFWPPNKLPLLHVKTRDLVGIAEPVGAFAFDDPAGAKLSSRMDGLRRKAIVAAGENVPDVDTVAIGLQVAALIPPARVAAPIARVSVSAEAAAVADSMAETPKARADRQREKNLKAQRQQSERLARITRALKGTKS